MTNSESKPFSIYEEPIEECPLCGSSAIKEKYTVSRFALPFSISGCKTCGFLFMNPPFTDEQINSFYTKEYYGGSANYSYIDERTNEKASAIVWDKRIETLHKYVPSGNFLDVGAAFGGLMKAAGRFYKMFGIELSPYAAEHAANISSATVHQGTLDNHPFNKNFFSAITMIELIEHLKNPVKAINECFELLHKGGVLVIQTANMAGLQAVLKKDKYGYFLPGHLSYFSKSNLTSALLKAGFLQVKAFIPVEFGLLPKLKKSAAAYKSIWDYRHWIRISLYHAVGKLHIGNFSPTSSMVLYAFK